MADNSSANPSRALPQKRTYYLVGYNVVLVTIMAITLYNVLLSAAKADLAFQKAQAREKTTERVAAARPAVATPSPATEGTTDSTPINPTPTSETAIDQAPVGAPSEDAPLESRNLIMISYVLWAISLAGGLGGALSNLRGVFEHARDKSYFPEYLELPFYLRPISGVLCGLFTFFLARFFTISMSSGENLGSGWQSLEGMMPYIGIAFLAGFASQEFMERLKETAKSLFGVPTQLSDVPAPPPANNESAQAGDKELESLDGGGQARGLVGPKAKTPPPAVTPPQAPLRRGD